MSIFDQSTILALDAAKMQSIGTSLANSIYKTPITICLSGELGAGKTTLVQGLAKALGVRDRVVSPTYALEQRYGTLLSHIDLYRLSEKQAKEFVITLEVFPGIRAVEWSNRHDALEHDIAIDIKEVSQGREVTISFSDFPIPSDQHIDAWREEVRLPAHIVKHTEAVATVAGRLADTLIERGTIVRKNALHAAARTHDLLRFVDFKDWNGDGSFAPSEQDIKTWTRLKNIYGTPHEAAAEQFLSERGFPEIGTIVRPHRGYSPSSLTCEQLTTTEQKLLAYSDKRVCFDKIVSIDERFDDFEHRYGNGKKTKEGTAARALMKKIEAELYPDGIPF